MPATVDIHIKGVAIYYQKEVDGKNVWRVLFPFDRNCHTVELGYEKIGDETFLGHLGKANGRIEITTEGATSQTDATDAFNKGVFDLTVPGRHKKLKMKDGWEERGVLMTIDNIVLDVGELLRMSSGLGLVLVNEQAEYVEQIDTPAYSVKGTIKLGEQGRVIVKDGTTEIFSTKPDEFCTLIFNNDCIQSRGEESMSDMELFYGLVEEPDMGERKFHIEGLGKKGYDNVSSNDGGIADAEATGPNPGFLESSGDKPCLGSKISVDTQDLA